MQRRMLAAGAAALVALAGCGGGKESQDADEPEGNFPVEIVKASFPTKQRLADQSQLEITVRNAGDRPVPNVAVTVQGDRTGSSASAAAFAEASEQQGLADPSRPVWILDDGPRGGTTAYVNTWALGRIGVGQTKTFRWRVTAVKPGTHTVTYRVAAGLNGKAKAVLRGGREPAGQFTVAISGKPADARVGAGGEVIVSPR